MRRRPTRGDERVFHVMNRATEGNVLFADERDARLFLCTLHQARTRIPVEVHAYCLMPNHWHLLLGLAAFADLPGFARWFTAVHAQRLRTLHGTRGRGAVYHDRYLAVPISDDRGFYQSARYIERNPVRAQLVSRTERWPWSSACQDPSIHIGTACWPVPRPHDWNAMTNDEQPDSEVQDIRTRLAHNRPIGGDLPTLIFAAGVRSDEPGA